MTKNGKKLKKQKTSEAVTDEGMRHGDEVLETVKKRRSSMVGESGFKAGARRGSVAGTTSVNPEDADEGMGDTGEGGLVAGKIAKINKKESGKRKSRKASVQMSNSPIDYD